MPDWSEDDRLRVALGEITLAELATLRGVSRQAAHQAFRRRGWATGREWPEGGPEAQDPPAGVAVLPATSAGASPAAAPIALVWSSDEDLAELARLETRNAGLLLLSKVRDQLSGPHPLSPQAAKMAATALSLSVDLLERLGLPIAADMSQAVPRMLISEMTAAEMEATQAAAEAAHRGEYGGDDGDEPALDDTLAPEPASGPHGDGGTSAEAEAPPAAAAPQWASEPPCATDLKRLERRLREAAERHGATLLRSWCVARGLPASRDIEVLVEILIAHAKQNADFLAWVLAQSK